MFCNVLSISKTNIFDLTDDRHKNKRGKECDNTIIYVLYLLKWVQGWNQRTLFRFCDFCDWIFCIFDKTCFLSGILFQFQIKIEQKPRRYETLFLILCFICLLMVLMVYVVIQTLHWLSFYLNKPYNLSEYKNSIRKLNSYRERVYLCLRWACRRWALRCWAGRGRTTRPRRAKSFELPGQSHQSEIGQINLFGKTRKNNFFFFRLSDLKIIFNLRKRAFCSL